MKLWIIIVLIYLDVNTIAHNTVKRLTIGGDLNWLAPKNHQIK